MKVAFIIVVCVLLFIVVMVSFFAYLGSKYSASVVDRTLDVINEESPYRRDSGPVRPNNDFLAKDKEEEKLKQEELEKAMGGTGVAKYMPPERVAVLSQEIKIVGVAKPVGFWSRFIMNQKLGFMLALGGLQNDSKNGYWVNLIKAQAASQSKEQGRGR